MSDLGSSMDLPYEPTTGELHDDHVHYSGGVVVMASVVNVPTVGPKPGLVFRFATPTGEFYPPVVLVCDDDQIAKLRPLVNQAIADARRGAQTAHRKESP
jgi:hypothetical protein